MGYVKLSEKDSTNLRFATGARVECNHGPDNPTWKLGTVVKLFYVQGSFPKGMCAPYQIKLDDGAYIYAPVDSDHAIRHADIRQRSCFPVDYDGELTWPTCSSASTATRSPTRPPATAATQSRHISCTGAAAGAKDAAKAKRPTKRSQLSLLIDGLDHDSLSLVLKQCTDEALFEIYCTCQQMKTMVNAHLAARRTVLIVGLQRDGKCKDRSWMGEYKRERTFVNGYATYIKPGSSWCIWRNSMHWFIGMQSQCGTRNGRLRVRSAAPLVEEVRSTWREWESCEWERCLVTCWHGDMLATKLAAASDVIALWNPSSKPTTRLDLLGVFEKRAASVNGFPSYVKSDDKKVFLWYRRGCWIVGVDRGGGKGWMQAFKTTGLLPEFCGAQSWTVIKDQLSIELQCLVGRAAIDAHFANASPFVAFADPTLGDGQAKMMGVYEKAGSNVNGYPSYEMTCPTADGRADKMMVWRAAGYWYAGAQAKVGRRHGVLRMASGGGLMLEDAREGWKRNRAPQSGFDWQEEPSLSMLLKHPKPPVKKVAVLMDDLSDFGSCTDSDEDDESDADSDDGDDDDEQEQNDDDDDDDDDDDESNETDDDE